MDSKVIELGNAKKLGRPSLYTGEAGTIPEKRQDSILSGLDEINSRWRAGKSIVIAGLMIGLVATAWYGLQMRPDIRSLWPITTLQTPPGRDLAASSVQPQPNQPVVTPEQPIIADPIDPQSAPAVVVADAPQIAPSTDQAEIAQGSIPAVALASSKLFNGASHEDNVPVKPDAVTPPDAQKNQGVEKSADSRVAASAPTGVPTKLSAKTSRNLTPGAAAGKPAEDGDVALIAALLNRVAPRAEQPERDSMRKSGVGETRVRNAAMPAAKEKKTVNKRGNTLLANSESTETLLKRCQTKGFFEAELCRFRTCSGRWESEPACSDSPQVAPVIP